MDTVHQENYVDCASCSNLVSDDESFGCCPHFRMFLNMCIKHAIYCSLNHNGEASFTCGKR